MIILDKHIELSCQVCLSIQTPTADPQSLSTREDTPLDIILTGSDPDWDPLTFTVVSTPTHGILGGVAPNLTYTQTVNYDGTESFTFLVNDGHLNSEPAVVVIEVTSVNDAPVVNPQSVTTRQTMPVMVTLSGPDIDGDNLTYHVVIPPNHGTLSGTGHPQSIRLNQGMLAWTASPSLRTMVSWIQLWQR